MATERADFPEDKYMHEIHRLKIQRDELLAACERAAKTYRAWGIEGPDKIALIDTLKKVKVAS